jgi:hypothetical protein
MENPGNGRVQLLNDQHFKIYNMYESHDNRSEMNFSKEAVKGTHTSNILSDVFFGTMNIAALQGGIRYRVYIDSNKKHIIDEQSVNELKLIMRAIYLENSRFSDSDCWADILSEVKRLNGLVIDYAVPRIIEEINMFLRYRSDINQLPVPMARSENPSSKGTKILYTKEF